jgi:hypothetical protein
MTTTSKPSSRALSEESLLVCLVSGERQPVDGGASVVFDKNRVICRDEAGNDLRSFASADLAFITRGTASPSLNVWI